jgi:tetratricopeptide (TPR) repeat protein
MGATLLHRGILAESLTHLRAAVEQSHNRDSATRPFDAGPLAMSYLAVVLMAAGYPDQASEVAARTMRTAEQLAKPSNIAFCAINVAAMHQLSFNPQAALTVADSAAELARAHGAPQLASALDVYTGWGVAAAGKPSEGAERIRRGIAGWLADGGRLPHAWYLSLLGWTYALDRRFEEAEETMKDAAAAVASCIWKSRRTVDAGGYSAEARLAETASRQQALSQRRGPGPRRSKRRGARRSNRPERRRCGFSNYVRRSVSRLLSGRGEARRGARNAWTAARNVQRSVGSFDIGEANRLL